ncbi:hypothetical protein G6F46_005773 [Rhizopus delemar]|uniref:SEC7 domain-containing protein n=3 Tax=Rhizopus TaxID=4842 RepID=I1CCY3_RHIO9|nr:hypothetical protein RO3G_11024 [Rhizopus delemar RA 99-880]KAG1460072.1 hypothetical protein G6F55_004383 [Rhizopus delemar]KAG1544622.1 hypothetical protein G6F51_005951 [Rhizopus arrhizus]KAG1498404.1 hypothetical protein G6F54_005107 [Rhizopus delemar]KAG1512275.1 hypothetical protein G6F53_005306 [Rhizopus delemar]|eukprot:EIE86313.1 hypothetical protein RO3G_11024 [Rhizopus delemar RA 99-880]
MENEAGTTPTDTTPRPSSTNREYSVYAKSGIFNSSASLISNATKERKSSTSSLNSNSGPSFTQRLIDRGVAVPSSFSSWEKIRPSEDSSSPGSYDFDSYYGMSPFITPSFSTNEAPHFHQDGPLYKSLRHRYEKEKHSSLKGDSIDEEEGVLSSPEFLTTSNHKKKYSMQQPKLSTHKEKPSAEDSDIELSDEEENNHPIPTLSLHDHKSRNLLLHNSRTRRSRSPLSFTPTSESSNRDSLKISNYHQDMYDELLERNKKKEANEEKVTLSPSTERLKNLLITPPKKPEATNNTFLPIRQPKPLSSPPRKHLLQTPVFQVVNANTVKDRYLFLFNDLLLICKPIMDENIIVSNSSTTSTASKNSIAGKERYRFRPNENSLFQVKNIVELSKLTLYISKDDYYATHAKAPTIEIGPDGRPILPPARKIHPIMASALRKFEKNANLGIQYLIDKGVLTNDPLSIANFLFKTPDLNRRQLGYYLADQNNVDVYDAFLECFRLVGLRLDEALRILLTTFRLPSLWEALEYIIERFAKKWHDANQNVIKFHEDMVVKVVVATLFLNAELWYDATSEKDVFWFAREVKERQGRQAKRKMSMVDYQRLHHSMNGLQNKHTSSLINAKNDANNRQSVAIEPLHYIMSLRAKGSNQPNLDEFLERWNYYDQYHLVPREFMEEMFKSIQQERLETGWDNKNDHRALRYENTEDSEQLPQDVVITVVPHRLPSRLTKGIPSDPITISIPAPDKGLQIKLRGQDLVFEPNILDFSNSCIQSFTITGNTLGRTSLMFIKSGENAGNYVSPTLPRTKTVVVERPFMRYTFQIGFKHIDRKLLPLDGEPSLQKKVDDKKAEDIKNNGGVKEQQEMEDDEEQNQRDYMVNRKYTFSVESLEERIEWLEALKRLSGYINGIKNEKVTHSLSHMSSESRVALQVLKEVLLADEVKKGTARAKSKHTIHSLSLSAATSPVSDNGSSILNGIEGTNTKDTTDDIPSNINSSDDRHGRVMKLLLPKKTTENRSSTISTSTTAANVVTKRGHEIIQLVVQNSMVPLVLSFLRSCTNDK